MTSDRVWLKSYPQGVPADIDPGQYSSLVGLMEESFARYADRTAYSFMGKDISYQRTDEESQAMAAYLQSLGLSKGDRVAVMMPNVPQYPVAVAGILRAGFVVVNVNPLYTPRELQHQLKDSGAKAIVIIENFATTLEKCIASTPVKHVVLCTMGDQLGLLKGALVNYMVRNVKNLVPAFSLPGAVGFNAAIAMGSKASFKKADIKADDVAVLQYTGGTTGGGGENNGGAGGGGNNNGGTPLVPGPIEDQVLPELLRRASEVAVVLYWKSLRSTSGAVVLVPPNRHCSPV